MFLASGAFIRGKFKDGFLEGIIYIKPTRDKSYLMKMDLGVLQGETTAFNSKNGDVKILEYKDGKFVKKLKEFKNYADKCQGNIIKSVFGLPEGTIDQIISVTKELSTNPDAYIGSFLIQGDCWYHGILMNGVPNGFGILIQKEGKIQMGWFEKGILHGYGRIIWPNSIVMDGVISKSQVNGKVIVYNGNSHDWMEAEFTENRIEKENEKGHGIPMALRIRLSREYQYRSDTSFEAEISPQVFYDEILQEKMFNILYGEDSEDCENFFEFSFPEESGNMDRVETRRDGSLHFTKYQGGSPVYDGTGSKEGNNSVVTEGNMLKDLVYSPQTGRTAGGSNIFHSDIRKSDSQKLETLAFTLGSSQKKHDYLQETGVRNLQGQFDNFAHKNEVGTVGMGPKEFATETIQEESSKSRMDVYEKKVGISKKKFPKGFDGLDVLILQRCLESIGKQEEKPGHIRARRSKRYVPGHEGVIKQTEANVIRNYVQDFMMPYIRKEKIEVCMKNIRGYKSKVLRGGAIKHTGQFKKRF